MDDNAPFFFFTLNLDQILHHQGMKEGMDWKVNLGVAVLGMVLVISFAAVILFLIVPLAMGAGTARVNAGGLLYFVVGRTGLHHGGDCVYSEIRPLSGASNLRPDSGGISFVAFQWHRKFGLPEMAARD